MDYKESRSKSGLHVNKGKLSGKTIGSPEGPKGKGKSIILGSHNRGTSKLDGTTK